MKYSWRPDKGLFQNLEPFDVPPGGLTYCRNWTHSRKDGCLTRSQGKEKFTSAACASGTSIRGIGVLDPYANPNTYQQTVREVVVASTDDCFVVQETSNIVLAGSYVECGYYSSQNRHMGFRFQTVNIANATTIISAHIRLNSYDTLASDVEMRIYGEDVDDSATFSTYADFAGRSLTSASVNWDVNSGEIIEGEWYTSPDIKTIIQEIVDRAGWAANQDMAIIIKNDQTSADGTQQWNSYDQSLPPILEIETAASNPTRPKYYFWATSLSDGHAYDEEDVSTDISQAATVFAFEKQAMLYNMLQFKDTDYTFNYLISTDFKEYPQKLDRVAGDAATSDLTTDLKFKYMDIFKRRLFGGYVDVGGTRYEKSVAYSAITDPTTWDTTNQIQHLPGSDEITSLKARRDILNAYCSNSIWYFDYNPMLSDPDKFPAFCHTTAFGHLGANVASRGTIDFILTESGIGAFTGGSNLQIISNGIRTDLEYVLRSNLAGLVWMKYHPLYDELWVSHPISGYTRNVVISRYSFKYNTWTQDDIKEANIMHYIHDVNDNYNPKMIFGAEDGILYKEGTEQNDSAAFDADFRSGMLFLGELGGLGNRRRMTILKNLHIWENESMSTGLKIYIKQGNYPWEWDSESWNSIGTITDNCFMNVDLDQKAWYAIKVLSDDSSEKTSISQIDFEFEDGGEFV